MRQWQIYVVMSLLTAIAAAVIAPIGWELWQQSQPVPTEFERF